MISETRKAMLESFALGRKSYKLADFETARTHFLKALELEPEDGPSKIYVARCSHYIENPPPEDWDGVFVMKSK